MVRHQTQAMIDSLGQNRGYENKNSLEEDQGQRGPGEGESSAEVKINNLSAGKNISDKYHKMKSTLQRRSSKFVERLDGQASKSQMIVRFD
mmetsp:Transcript_364/g.680  ORF Transcript_364/g.680 Transcript_364/m.680 type:complete len:91 (-) Transcript_364:1531-1803(-)